MIESMDATHIRRTQASPRASRRVGSRRSNRARWQRQRGTLSPRTHEKINVFRSRCCTVAVGLMRLSSQTSRRIVWSSFTKLRYTSVKCCSMAANRSSKGLEAWDKLKCELLANRPVGLTCQPKEKDLTGRKTGNTPTQPASANAPFARGAGTPANHGARPSAGTDAAASKVWPPALPRRVPVLAQCLVVLQ